MTIEPILRTLLGRGVVYIAPAKPTIRAASIVHPSDPVGWMDSLDDGATCGEPVPLKMTSARRKAADERQREFVQRLRNQRCSAQ